MFAVPGWSVSADTLKTQEETKSGRSAQRPDTHYQHQHQDHDGDAGENPKKRKRRKGRDQDISTGPTVTDENLADLWKQYVEDKGIEADGREDEAKLESHPRRKKKKGGPSEAITAVKSTNHTVIQESHQDGGESGDQNNEDSGRLGAEIKALPGSDDAVLLETTTAPAQLPDSKLSGKAKYQHRKLLALKKKELKARLQAAGSHIPSQSSPLNQPNTIRKAKASPPPGPTSSLIPPQQPSPTPPDCTSIANTLTPLQSQMRSKLIAARFRHLNETLYTSTSNHALNLFTESPSSFASYHAGFRAQVSVWPQNPIDTFIADLKARANLSVKNLLQSQKRRWRDERKNKNKNAKPLSEATNDSSLAPLPRSQTDICTIADLGCGDAKLAASLLPVSVPNSLRILSYDLSTGDGPNAALITVADLCRLPLKDNEVDLAVLCLALMGTNWVDGVDEVRRVVRSGGEVWVAEIRSRFQRGDGTNKQQTHGKTSQMRKNQKQQPQQEPTTRHDNDENDDYENETTTLDNIDDPSPHPNSNPPIRLSQRPENGANNLSSDPSETRSLDPFLDIWRRRGFALCEPIDQSNRMFIRMKFTKLPSPSFSNLGVGQRGGSHGSGVQGGSEGGGPRERESAISTWIPKSRMGVINANANANANGSGSGSRGKKNKSSWINRRNEDGNGIDKEDAEKMKAEEGKVLKPCVYKIR